MRILKLKIQNFCQHKLIEFDANSPVVGLVGINGAGKSNFLAALEFALTGETRDPIESYVRHGDGNAVVEMTFSKNGHTGTIMRQFGKTPKRALTWDNQKPITKAKEVDEQMAKIFGADKKAVSNAVFINQGMMESILFLKDADRRGMFIKLVNMSFCAGRAKIIDTKVKRLETTIEDLAPVIQATATQREAAATEVNRLQAEIAKLKDYRSDIEFCQKHIQNTEALAGVSAAMGSLHNSKMLLIDESTRLCSRFQLKTLKEVEQGYLDRETHYNTALGIYNENCRIYTELSHFDRVSSELATLNSRLEEENKKFKESNPLGLLLPDVEAQLSALQGPKRCFEQIEALQLSRKEWSDYVDRSRNELKLLIPPAYTEDAVMAVKDSLMSLNVSIQALQTAHITYSRLAKCLKVGQPDEKTKCPDCGLTLADPSELSLENLKGIAESLEERRVKRDSSQKFVTSLEEQWKKYQADCRAKTDAIRTAVENVAKIDAAIQSQQGMTGNITREECLEKIDRLTKLREFLDNSCKTIATLVKDLHAKACERDSYTTALAHQVDKTDYAIEKLKDQHTNLTELGKQLGIWKTAVQVELQPLKDRLLKLDMQWQADAEQKRKLEAALEIPMPEEVRLLQAGDANNGNMLATKSELEARQSIRMTTQGRLDQANEVYTQTNTRYQDLLRRTSADAEKRKLIDDLKTLRGLLSDDGLPMRVVRHHFRHLAVLTQEALTKLDANFSITIDEVEPLAFKFVRLDDSVQYEMPMEKLSGGQRIRLCLAFLMAVQRRLVSEVGLLVLDEPSNHVDTEGKEALAELLTSMQARLATTDMQIWCADHDPILASCFGKTLQLKLS